MDSDATDIWGAAVEGDLYSIGQFLKQGVDVNAKNESHESLLFIATKRQQIPVVQYLVLKGADINTTDRNGTPVINVAAMYGNVGIARILLNAGSRPDMQIWIPVLRVALRWPLMVKLLIDFQFDIHYQGPFSKRTFLMTAAREGYAHTMRILINAGVDIHAVDLDGANALKFAIRNHQTEAIHILFEAILYREKMSAFAMGLQPRLGKHSMISLLHSDVVTTILENVEHEHSL